LLGIGVAATWILGGWLMALAGVIMLVNGGSIGAFICLMLGLMWGGYSAKWALER
jgi:hypothetical protein